MTGRDSSSSLVSAEYAEEERGAPLGTSVEGLGVVRVAENRLTDGDVGVLCPAGPISA